MIKIAILSIDPTAEPRPFGGTSSLIPSHLAAGGSRAVDIVISIDSDAPARGGVTTYEGDDAHLVDQYLQWQYGLYGKMLGEEPSPSDMIHTLTGLTWLKWEILEGKEILDLPVPELPPGAMP